MTIEREGEKPGHPPPAMWVSFSSEDDDEQVIIALVGLNERIEPLWVDLVEEGIKFPCVDASIGGLVKIAVMFIGRWPSKQEGDLVVRQLGIDPKEWVKRLVQVVEENPDHIFKHPQRFPDDMVDFLFGLYIDECKRAIWQGQTN